MKRAFDIVAAAVALLLVLPLMGVVALAIWSKMGRPVLFRQTRTGQHEQPFVLYKFRTMHDAPGLDDAHRLTPLGCLLRRTSMDELPELFNVLRGDMSLVGPRPLLLRYLPYYTEHERLRHTIRPGLTGWSQIHGRNRLPWNQRLAFDAWYAEHHTLGLDLRILARTLRAAVTQDGVLVDPTAVLPDLDEERRTRPQPTLNVPHPTGQP